MEKKNIFSIIESYYLAQVLLHLNNKGLFKNYKEKARIKTYFPNEPIYRFFKSRTDMIQSDDGKYFKMNPSYSHYLNLGFHVEKFLGAYGQFNLDGKTPAIITDNKKFADAFGYASKHQNLNSIVNILSATHARTVLDLGCGTGNLVLAFCKKNKHNHAIGIDQNPYLHQLTKEKIKKSKLTGRAKVIQGNVTNFDQLLSKKELHSIDVLYGSSILNEFFASPDLLVQFLKKIKKFFPGKYMVVADYYGVFSTSQENRKDLQHNYVHDVMQMLSGQGIPASNKKKWNEYYIKAKCSLVHAYEGRDQGINWFIHIIKLE